MKNQPSDPHSDNQLDTFVEAHLDYLFHYALRQLKDEQLAEEAVQETLASAIASIEKFEGRAQLRTWLTSILKFKIIDIFRRQARDKTQSLDQMADAEINTRFKSSGHFANALQNWGASPEEILQQRDFQAAIENCIDGLPDNLNAVFMLRINSDKSVEEVSNDLGLSATNVGVMLYRARMRLRDCLEKTWFEAK